MSRSNILIIVADDQRADTIRALGNQHIDTPALDRLLAEGSWLRPSTTVPVCTPGRAELLTGCDAYANGCRWFEQPIDPGLVLLPEAFRRAGWRTCHVGKWHNDGHPSAGKGFDQAHLVFPHDVEGGYLGRGYWRAHEVVYRHGEHTIGGHSSDVLCHAAEEVIAGLASGPPWFCWLALHSPHDPRRAPEPWASHYLDARLPPLPDDFMPEHPFDNGDMLIRDELLEEFPRRPGRIRRHLADYYAMISHHDACIGRLLERLDRLGILDDTIVVFTSDHGLAIGSHGLMGKENLYEHSHTVSCILRGPGIPAGRRARFLARHEDLYPTLCDLAGVAAPPGVRGRSYRQALVDDAPVFREEVHGAYRDCMRSIRRDQWKLIHYPRLGRSQLFDLACDPNECCDLLIPWRRRASAAGPDRPDGRGMFAPWPPGRPPEEADAIAAALSRRLADWLAAAGDPCPTLG